MFCDLDERADAGAKSSHNMRRVSASSTVVERTRLQLLRSTTASEAADSRSWQQSNGDDVSRATAATTASSCPKEGADANDQAGGVAEEDDEVQSAQSLPFKTLALAQLYQSSRRSRNSATARTSPKGECADSSRTVEMHPLPFMVKDVGQCRPVDSSSESKAATPAQKAATPAQIVTGHNETLDESRRDKTHQQQHDTSPEWAFDFVPVHRHSLYSDAASISSMESLSLDFFDQPDKVTGAQPSAKRRKRNNVE
ncbi:hypothetical protein THAOC_24528 [Thalassiosira oceanica]|uniref:Uncharacterized protein n=1 Tax=Thalassiosira oceanica TaxID=159749 RepID=K0SAI6_THAOC|nr:hypothetical protein THAOC_24528 [Thalassiosira oceanica]|eukprot:EJK55712.1 hypothetical protein THAOC_24528 [Thalassiosira oceanica]